MRKIRTPAILLTAGLVGNIVVSLVLSAQLPERVATHFNAAGQANGWMTRSQNLTFELAFGLGMPLFIAGLMYCMRFIPGSAWNVPNKQYWMKPENHQRAADLMFRLGLWMAALISIWITALDYQIFLANQTQPPHLPAVPIIVSAIVLLIGALAWVIILMRLFSKVPPESKAVAADHPL